YVEDLLARIQSRAPHGVAAAPGHMRSDGLPLVRVTVRVRSFNADLRDGHGENLGGNLRNGGQEALADFHARDEDVQARVLVEFQKGRRGSVGRHRRSLPEQNKTFAANLGWIRGRLRFSPSYGRSRLVNSLRQAIGAHACAVRKNVAFADGIVTAEGDRIDPKPPGRARDVRLQSEGELRVSKAA